MSEKKAKEARKQLQTPNAIDFVSGQFPNEVGYIKIHLLNNGQVEVSGHINKELMVVHAFGNALMKLAGFWANERMKAQSPIIQPPVGFKLLNNGNNGA